MLRNEKIQEIINLLEQGYTCQQTADLSGVSLATVKKVSSGKRHLPLIPKVRSAEPAYTQVEPVRCKTCGCLTTIQPCPACEARRLKTQSVSGENDTESTALHLEDKEFKRYIKVRRKVERQINDGIREPLSAVGGDFVAKT